MIQERHKQRTIVNFSGTINQYTYLESYPTPSIDELVHNKAKNYLKSAYYQIPEKENTYNALKANYCLFQFNRIPFGLSDVISAFQRNHTHILHNTPTLTNTIESLPTPRPWFPFPKPPNS